MAGKPPGWYHRGSRLEEHYWDGEYWSGFKRELDLDGNVKPTVGTYRDAVTGEVLPLYEPPLNEKLVCPHCQSSGCVTVEPVKGNALKRAGAIAAVGVIGLAVRPKGPANKMHCRECGMDWYVPLA